MTTVNMLNDRSHDILVPGSHPVRHARLRLAVAVAGITVVLTGVAVSATVLPAMASRSGTQLQDSWSGHVGSQLRPDVHGQPIDDWPWSTRTTALVN